jgi:hypothetical protein
MRCHCNKTRFKLIDFGFGLLALSDVLNVGDNIRNFPLLISDITDFYPTFRTSFCSFFVLQKKKKSEMTKLAIM